MFEIGESVSLAFDQRRRLRVMAPEEYLPLAAWLHTDAQPNSSALDQLVRVLQWCRQEEWTLVGNGCVLDFVRDVVVLESRFGTWPRTVVPQSAFWPVLDGMRAFLAGTATAPGLVRPAGYPDVRRVATERQRPDDGKRYLLDHTCFPVEWTPEQVREAGDGAWRSADLLRDPTTGTWSGMWRDLVLAGYFDRATGEVLTYFPVISP